MLQMRLRIIYWKMYVCIHALFMTCNLNGWRQVAIWDNYLLQWKPHGLRRVWIQVCFLEGFEWIWYCGDSCIRFKWEISQILFRGWNHHVEHSIDACAMWHLTSIHLSWYMVHITCDIENQLKVIWLVKNEFVWHGTSKKGGCVFDSYICKLSPQFLKMLV